MIKKQANTFSCYLIGHDSLLLQCAEVLLNKGHQICGIISPDHHILAQTQFSQIKIYSSLDLVDWQEFDYLFSVINPILLPNEILKRPKKIAINYHDSPLPKYAGVHATSWAIINDEKEHGITWHIMSDEIDAGDIVKQKLIKISSDETALSLNLKCNELALQSFEELVQELAEERCQVVQQNLSERSYYGMYQKPPANGFIDWEQNAEQIDRLVRALTFGNTKNDLATPKIWVNAEVFIAEKLEVLAQKSTLSPGQIVSIDNNGIVVATASYDIKLVEIASLNRNGCDLHSFAQSFNLQPGWQFALIGNLASSLKDQAELSAKSEKFWINEWYKFQPVTFPFLDIHGKNYSSIERRKVVEIEIKNDLLFRLKESFFAAMPSESLVTTLLLIYFYRLNNKENQGIGYATDSGNKIQFGCLQPFYTGFSDEMNYSDCLKLITEKIEIISSKYPYLSDLLYRFPNRLTGSSFLFPIGIYVNLGRNIDYSCHSIISFSIENNQLRIFVNKEYCDENLEIAVKNIAGHLQVLLNDIIENPSKSIGTLEYLASEERRRILFEWNQTERDFPRDKTIHQLFEEQVESTPDSIAVIFEDQRLTYRELNEKANQVASYLEKVGVGSQGLVAICIDRSLEMIIGIMGILKTGCAYLPIDPYYPEKRIQYILKDADAKFLLISCELKNIQLRDVTLINITQILSSIGDKEGLLRPSSSENLAYIIYTSGSTGLPKGVKVTHKGVSNLVRSQIEYFKIDKNTRLLQFASISFDASVSEIFTCLLAGGILCLIDDVKRKDPIRLIEFIKKNAINVVTLPPSLLEIVNPEQDLPLKTLIVAGEACGRKTLSAWAKKCRVINAYGPTEYTVCISMADYNDELSEKCIGRPINNTKVYVLDSNLLPVAVGVIGELCVSGVGLSCGYLSQDDLTSEKFVKNFIDYGDTNYQRLYRTGDLVHWLPDGTLSYVGRKDTQLKLKGIRINLEEIDSILESHDLVKHSVTLVDQRADQKNLVSFVILDEERNKEDQYLELWPSLAEYYVYDEILYYTLTHDYERNRQYFRSFEKKVKDKVVLDVGTGKDAVLARMCVQAGAKKVFAIELLESSYKSALRKIAEEGLTDKIEIIHGNALDIELTVKIDVIVSEIFGSIAGAEGAVPILNSVRKKMLQPGGLCLPYRCITKMAVTSLPETFLRNLSFSDMAAKYVEKVFVERGRQFDLRVCIKNLGPSHINSTEGIFEDLDFSEGEVSLGATLESTLVIKETKKIDGFVLWLDLEIDEEFDFTTLFVQSSWVPVYVPAFYPGIEARKGDVFRVKSSRQISGNNLNSDYLIKGDVLRDNVVILSFEYKLPHFDNGFKKSIFYEKLFYEDGSVKYENSKKHISLSKTLRDYLAEYLPSYMLPKRIMVKEAFPITNVGKIDKEVLLADLPLLDQVEAVESSRNAQQVVLDTLSRLLNNPEIDLSDNFFELGGDSIIAMQMIARLMQIGFKVAFEDIFKSKTLFELASNLQVKGVVSQKLEVSYIDFPLSPIQKWFFDNSFNFPSQWSQVCLFEVDKSIDEGALIEKMRFLIGNCETLRLRFHFVQSEWRQYYSDDQSFVFKVIKNQAGDDYLKTVEHLQKQVQAQFDLSSGPLVGGVLLLDENGIAFKFLLIIHHLLIDGVSWRIITEMLNNTNTTGEGLIYKSASFRGWVDYLSAKTNNLIQSEVDAWKLKKYDFVLPKDFEYGENNEKAAKNHTIHLNLEQTSDLLRIISRLSFFTIDSVLLAILAISFSKWSKMNSFLINYEHHGREVNLNIDLSNSIGWFTSYYPLFFNWQQSSSLQDIIEIIQKTMQKDSTVYSLLRYLSDDDSMRESLKKLDSSEMSFNYWGQLDKSGAKAGKFNIENLTYISNEDNKRRHLIDVNCWINRGRLHITWVYSGNHYHRETIQKWGQLYLDVLQHFLKAHDFSVGREGLSNIKYIYPLTPMQEGMLFHSLEFPRSQAYIIQLNWNMVDINVDRFCQAWQILLDRHDILRTGFKAEHYTSPLQIVYNKVELNISKYDWSSLDEDDFKERYADFLKNDREEGFVLLEPPLIRLKIIKDKTSNYYIVMTLHHILLDGWSAPVLFDELNSIYESLLYGRLIDLPKPLEYRDYVEWLKRSYNASESESFWRSYLFDLQLNSLLPIKKKLENSFNSFPQYKVIERELTKEISKKINAFARKNSLTMSTIFQAAWAILLSRYSQSRDIVFGVTSSIRPYEDKNFNQMIGLFINTLPLRVKLGNDETVLSLLQKMQYAFINEFKYFLTPLMDVKQWMGVSPKEDIFESIVVVENYPFDSKKPKTIDFKSVEFVDYVHYLMALIVIPRDQITLKLHFNKTLIEETLVEGLIGHLTTVLSEMLNKPNELIKRIKLLTEPERKEILRWSQSSFKVDNFIPLPRLFERQAELYSDAIAIVFEEQELTYFELNEKANRLANFLINEEIGPESLVSIYMERGLNVIIAILGVAKTGAAYLPIDASYPDDRVKYIVDHSGSGLVLTHDNLENKLSTIVAGKVRCKNINTILSTLNISPANPIVDIKPNFSMYAIYTSGSTGNPKGVMIEHGSLAHLFKATEKKFHFNNKDVWTLFHSVSFDFSVWEIWGPLIYGGKLIIVPDYIAKDPLQFYQLLNKSRVTILNQTPSAFSRIVEIDEQLRARLFLRFIIFDGEVLSPKIVLPWIQRHGYREPRLINMYGITETTVHLTYCEISPEKMIDRLRFSIGKGIPGVSLFVLDENMQILPVGIPGDLYVGGNTLARGYLNDLKLTNERFISESNDLNVRLYKTGDIACWLKYGELDYQGRSDNQIKIRGFRVELDEIARKIELYSYINSAIVIARETDNADKQLIAYFTTNGIVDIADLRQFLEALLPSYMMPSAFVSVEKFLLTSNGKINYKMLPSPTRQEFVQDNYIEPKTDNEIRLAAIWKQVLGLEKIGITDNFFDLGGSSLSVLKVINEIKAQLSLDLPVRTLYSVNTIEKLAKKLVEEVQEVGTELQSKFKNVIELFVRHNKPILFLVHPVGGTVFWYHNLVKYLNGAYSLYAIQDPGIESDDLLFNNIEEMAAHYVYLIRQIQPKGPYMIGGASAGATISFEMARQLLLMGQKIIFLGLFDGWVPHPDMLRDKDIFEKAMMRQYQEMAMKFQSYNIAQSQKLLNLQWHRSQMLDKYLHPFLETKVTLFKAAETILPYQSYESRFNHWDKYTPYPIERHIVSGDHETMFQEPYVRGLVSELNKCIDLVIEGQDAEISCYA